MKLSLGNGIQFEWWWLSCRRHHARKWQSPNAATLDGQRSPEWISGLRGQRQHLENHVSLDFELSTNEARIPSNFLSSMVVHNALGLGGECRRARSRQRTCRSTW